MKKRPRLSPRKKPTQERSRHTVEAILQASAWILARDGYDAMTTNRIAERAGVNIATLYQYFPGKEAVFVELLRRHVAETRAAALEVMERSHGTSLEAATRASVDAVIAAHRVTPALHRVFTEQSARLGVLPLDAPTDAAMAQRGREWIDRSRGQLPDPELALWIAGHAVHALVHQAILERPKDLDSPVFAAEITRLVTGFLRGQVSPSGAVGPRRDARSSRR